jgi:hypothetical protein
MKRDTFRIFTSVKFLLAVAASIVLLAGAKANGQCLELTSGLQLPLGITQSNQGNLLVGESGTSSPNTGRISIVDLNGNRRTLVDGLPSGRNDVDDPSSAAGLFIRGRTLYVAIGIGDAILAGPFLGAGIANANPSSPILSSILAIHFSADVENTTVGFTLTGANQLALSLGQKVTLEDQAANKITIEMLANFPDYTPNPIPTLPTNVRGTNPFDLVVLDNQIYVTDGGQNTVWQVDIPTGTFTTLASFPPVTNPFFPAIGGPVIEAVPTGIRYVDGQLLVTLFSGAPFAPGFSSVQVVDPTSGGHSTFIGGRKTVIDVLPIRDGDDTDYLVLQHASTGFFFGSPGQVLRFETPGDAPALVANCLTRPSSMVLDEKTGTLYVTEVGGRILAISVSP